MIEKPHSSTDDAAEAAIFAAELGKVPEIDLHGMTQNVALSELEAFFHSELFTGTEVIKIIHGRGDQILRNAIYRWLREPEQSDLIVKFRDSQNPAQQGAVTYVALHRLR
ncbi:MAG: Smr/MutS family protein [Patescibacteria group bacterium]